MKHLAEFIGTFLLVSVVVGSGIMAENISNGNIGIALLGNTIATGAILYVIIKMFGSISGAHFNPAVSFMFFLRKELNWNDYLKFSFFQCTGGLIAVLLIHYIFEINIFQISTNINYFPEKVEFKLISRTNLKPKNIANSANFLEAVKIQELSRKKVKFCRII